MTVVFHAITDSSGKIVNDTVYTAGETKTFDIFEISSKKLYTAGTKFKVLGYSALSTKVYRAGAAKTVYAYDQYTGALYSSGTDTNIDYYTTPSSNYYEGDGAAYYYKGNGSYVTGRGTAVSGTNLGGQVTTQFYTANATYGSDYGKMMKRSSSASSLYLAGSSYSYYKGDGSAGYLRGDSEYVYKRKAGAASGIYVYSSTKTVTLSGSRLNGTNGTKFYTRNSDNDASFTAIGSEYKNVYERDEDSDYEVTPILRQQTDVYENTGRQTTVHTTGSACTFTPAELTVQDISVLSS